MTAGNNSVETEPTSPTSPCPLPNISRRTLLSALPIAAGATSLLSGCREPAQQDMESGADLALPDKLWAANAGDLALAIKRGDLTSVEVVEAFLGRIEEVNGHINAVTRVLADEALAAARQADAARAAGKELGPLHGVPFTIKENLDVVGSPTTDGVPALADNMPESDATIVARIKAAGAIPLARTNLPDLGLRVHTTSSLHGLTRNPWHPNRNVGGSSGGEGAALASGMSCLGLGNDIGGSLRIPAQCNGIVSLKPTFGRLPRKWRPINPMSSQLMAVDGPMARTVADLDLAYRIMAGYDPTDPWSMPIPISLQRPEEPLKVAVVPEPSGGTTHPSVADGVRKAADALANQGYAVEEVEPPRLAEATRAWTVLLGVTVELGLDEMKKLMSPEAFQFLGSWQEMIELRGHQEYVENFALRADLATEWQLFQTEYPIIVAPILTQPPFELGFDERKENIPDIMEQMRFEVVLNLLGLPAVCVPVGVADGLPQVVEVVGGRYREDLCLEAAQYIENAYGLITPIDPKKA